MQAGGRVEDQVAGVQLDRLHAIGVGDLEFPAVVFVGPRQEQGGREIGAQLAAGARVEPHAAVDVSAEGHTLAIPVEHRRIDPVRQGGGDEQRVALQGLKDHRPGPRRHLRTLVDLLVTFDPRALPARGDAAIHPGVPSRQQVRAQGGDLVWRQDLGDGQHHERGPTAATRARASRCAPSPGRRGRRRTGSGCRNSGGRTG